MEWPVSYRLLLASDPLDVELAGVDHELHGQVPAPIAGTAATGGPRSDFWERLAEVLVEPAQIREDVPGGELGIAVDEEAIALDVAQLPALGVHLEHAVQEVPGDLLGVLDADVREKGRVAADVGQDEGSTRHEVSKSIRPGERTPPLACGDD